MSTNEATETEDSRIPYLRAADQAANIWFDTAIGVLDGTLDTAIGVADVRLARHGVGTVRHRHRDRRID